MSYSIKKSGTTTAKFKMLAVADGKNFVDYETGEIVDVADVIAKAMGGEPFDMQATTKTEEDITSAVE